MLCRKTKRFGKMGLAAINFILAVSILGCSDASKKEASIEETIIEFQQISDRPQEDTEEIINICIDNYKKAAEENKPADLETIRNIVKCFGENGYPAVDSRNQINMTEAEQVLGFCKKVDAQEAAEITILVIDYLGGFVKYDLYTKAGKVDVVRSYYKYENGSLQRTVTGSYQAEYWNYTEEGYLIFSGVWFSEESYVLTLSGAEEHTALRVQPLDETYRELCRKYLCPIGFEQNNMFLVDWSEDDFGELNFYDMYDILYPKVNGQYVPYAAKEHLSVSAVYRIPQESFEGVIMKYFKIDSKTLRSKTIFCEEDAAYEYKPRGFEEVEYPEYPYSEVVAFTENSDGTITLTANVVFPYAGDSKVYAHEVVVRPLENGEIQYVSNKIIPSDKNGKETWHVPRLTAEEWEGLYQSDFSDEAVYGFLPQAGESLLSEEEKEQVQSTVLSAAESVREIYKDMVIADAPSYASGINGFTDEHRKAVAEQLGRSGWVSVEEDTAMQNHEAIEDFYADYLAGRDAMVTVFEVHRDGLIGAVTFIYRKDKLQTYYIGVRWREGGVPEIQGTSVGNVAEIKLTEKGYFIYAYEYVVAHARLRQYWRIEPLSEDCKELTDKYISGLSYVNYDLLITDWDSSNAEEILMPCMYEDIYRIHTGENLETKNWRIPAEEYERIMTTYFPVSVEQLREKCGYDAGSDTYEYEMIFERPYPPFGEVVDYTKNADGTITLIVDGVWPDYNSDLAFRNTVVILPFDDGTFRYLSNSIEQVELELPDIHV